jgi:hypothetical protein
MQSRPLFSRDPSFQEKLQSEGCCAAHPFSLSLPLFLNLFPPLSPSLFLLFIYLYSSISISPPLSPLFNLLPSLPTSLSIAFCLFSVSLPVSPFFLPSFSMSLPLLSLFLYLSFTVSFASFSISLPFSPFLSHSPSLSPSFSLFLYLFSPLSHTSYPKYSISVCFTYVPFCTGFFSSFNYPMYFHRTSIIIHFALFCLYAFFAFLF